MQNWQKDLWAAVTGSGVGPGEIKIVSLGRQLGKSTYWRTLEQWMKMMRGTVVHHWRFEDGKTTPNPDSQWKMDPPPRGWYCWVYAADDNEFRDWMGRMCPTADVTHRFNSGDPMHTVYIKEDAEATLFQLKWGGK